MKDFSSFFFSEKMLHAIREHGVLRGIMYILLLSTSSQLTKDFGMAPGGEFRRAFQEVNRVYFKKNQSYLEFVVVYYDKKSL